MIEDLELEEEEPAQPATSSTAAGPQPEVVDRHPGWECWALLAFDSATGCATKVVAIAGMGDGRTAVSWVPLVSGADGWRQRLAETTAPLPEILAQVDEAGGIGAAFLMLEPPPAAVDLEGAVEMLMDELLAAPPEGAG